MPHESYGPVRVTRGRGQRGSLTQLPDGRWLARYYENGRDGKRPQKIFNGKREAQRWLRDRLDELDAALTGDTAAVTRRREAGLTVDTMFDRFLAAHDASAPTIKKLAAQLRKARAEFGSELAAGVEPYAWQAWRKTLPPGSAHYVFKAVSQVYRQAVRWDWLDRNPCERVPNPKPKRREVQIPTWDVILAIADEIDERYAAAPFVMAGAGLRVEEFLALERRDVDLAGRVLKVRRVYSSGELSELGADGKKTALQRRNVPLRQIVVEALQAMPTRIDTPLLFAAPRGGLQNSENFLSDFWAPAVKAAGVEHFPPKNLRHVYASELLDANINPFKLSRRMGTSLKEIDDTYGHLIPDDADAELCQLDAYDQANAALVGVR